MISREEAIKILEENLANKNMIKHCLASGVVMRGVHRYLVKKGNPPNETLEEWEMAGLLHDADAEKAKSEEQGVLVGQWLNNKISDQVKHAMAAHGDDTGFDCKSKMDWALYAGEKLTGLIVATALVLPSRKLADVTPEMVLRRFKEKSFAKGANRENILECEKLGVSLEEFVKIALETMQGISDQLGL